MRARHHIVAIRWIVPAGTVALLAVPFSTRDAGAQLAGSAHDFLLAPWNASGEMCAPCHTPHNGDSTVPNAPLWNHEVSVGPWIPYVGPGTMDVPMPQPAGVSRLCLSCHDGTVELDAYGGVAGGTPMGAIPQNLGTDLSNDHPVGIDWQHQTVWGPNGGFCANCHAVHDPNWRGPLPFPGRRVECTSCHDPHNRMPYNPGGLMMLRLPMTGSQLCTRCHNI